MDLQLLQSIGSGIQEARSVLFVTRQQDLPASQS